MGQPAAPTLANIFLCETEEKWLNECPLEFKPKFYRRCMYDIFLLFKNHEHIDKFLKYLNNKHPNIQLLKKLKIINH